MSKSTKAFLLGALVGAAVVHFSGGMALGSDKG